MEGKYIDEKFEFNAPQYCCDLNESHEVDESYFDKMHESVPVNWLGNIKKEQTNQVESLESGSRVVKLKTKTPTRYSPRLRALAKHKMEQSLRPSLGKAKLSTANVLKVKNLQRKKSYGSLRAINTLTKQQLKEICTVSTAVIGQQSKQSHNRLKVEAIQPVNEYKEVEFTRTLRSSVSSSTGRKSSVKRTTVKPFKLTEPSRRIKKDVKEFLSTAALTLQFQTKTPERFRTRPLSEKTSIKPVQEAQVTIPQTPNLRTARRTRGVHYPSRREQEVQEYEDAKKHQFKARPFDLQSLQAPVLQETKKKEPTKVKPFNITESKKEVLQKHALDELDTTASSCSSSTSRTVRLRKGATQVEPFSFASRDELSKLKKRQKIMQAIEEEKKLAEFHANPMPVLSDGVKGLPEKKPPYHTQLKPFQLRSDTRGSQKREAWENQVKEEQKKQEEQRNFHAQPADVLHQKPFVPERPEHPLSDVSAFVLNSERRAQERAVYDASQKRKEADLEVQMQQFAQRKEEEEAQEVAKMRKETVHKAAPVRYYKTVTIKRSNKPVTVPRTPAFATDRCLRRRRSQSVGSESTFNSK